MRRKKMTKMLKITRDEVIKALEQLYSIDNIKFMKSNNDGQDSEVFDNFEYIEGKM